MSAAKVQTSYAELATVLDSLPIIMRETRRMRGLSIRAAAKEVGCSFSTFHRIESGEDAILSNVTAIMRWLDATPPVPRPAGATPPTPPAEATS